VGFVQDALVNWTNDEGESLKVLYAVRLFLAMTLIVVLGLVPVVARLGKKAPSALAIFHHRVLTGYLTCAALGYISKSYGAASWDTFLTNVFFIVGPLICFGAWSWRMWKRSPEDLEPLSLEPTVDNNVFERRLQTP
jgi:hypothetical protein